jgi:hydrogenase expression/formation protein HypC
MCLAVPGRIVRWLDRDPLFAQAVVEFAGVSRVCHMSCVLEADVGEFVVVHAGVAISRVHATEATRLLNELRSLPELDDELSAIGDRSTNEEPPP